LLVSMEIEALNDVKYEQSCAKPLDRSSSNHQVGFGEFVDSALNRRRVEVASQKRARPAGRVGDTDNDRAAVTVGEADDCFNQHLYGFLTVGRGLFEVERLALQAGRSNAAMDVSEQLVEVV
jgi:hypothetical protein